MPFEHEFLLPDDLDGIDMRDFQDKMRVLISKAFGVPRIYFDISYSVGKRHQLELRRAYLRFWVNHHRN